VGSNPTPTARYNFPMELPGYLKALYRHWPRHIELKPAKQPDVDPVLLNEVKAFASERGRIWQVKEQGLPKPYTDDPILSHYRFCNVLRELDRQTVKIHQILNPLREDFPLWLLNMFYCRMVARPDTIRHAGLLSFDTTSNEKVLAALGSMARPRFGTAYVFPVSAIQRSATPTRELFITKFLPTRIPLIAEIIATWKAQTVYEGVSAILPRFGFNLAFLWTEVLIDTAYQYPERVDLFGRFPIGPGSIPTFTRLNAHEDPSVLAEYLGAARVPSGITFGNQPVILSAENWEGIGCEFRKYTNLQLGRGRRRIYR
jgi:hypothetical protein